MGAQTCRIVGKSQSVLIMIHPIISTRTRMRGGGGGVPLSRWVAVSAALVVGLHDG
eukprot:COSAG01_NODE_71495_length_255_cov_2.160256_1_plen_55_part_10